MMILSKKSRMKIITPLISRILMEGKSFTQRVKWMKKIDNLMNKLRNINSQQHSKRMEVRLKRNQFSSRTIHSQMNNISLGIKKRDLNLEIIKWFEN